MLIIFNQFSNDYGLPAVRLPGANSGLKSNGVNNGDIKETDKTDGEELAVRVLKFKIFFISISNVHRSVSIKCQARFLAYVFF